MMTQPFGFPPTSCRISLSKFAWSGFHEMLTPTLPPSFVYCATNSALSAVPNASFRAPTLTVAPLPNASTTAAASTLPCSVSEGYVRQR